MICPICRSERLEPRYLGLVREGRHGHWSEHEETVWGCSQCQAAFLPDARQDYEGDNYREETDGCGTIDHFYSLHDAESLEKVGVIGTAGLRGKVVADIGCGGGSFLDMLYGVAGKTIAIEPCRSYQESLAQRHEVYSYVSDALEDRKGGVDLLTCFAVIEHVDDPLALLRDAAALMAEGGAMVLSTPNADDWLLEFLPEQYGRFFYRRAHRWYFNLASLERLADMAGLEIESVVFKARYDVSNALHWIKEGAPTGVGKTKLFSPLDQHWKQVLEQSGRSDFIYIRMGLKK